MFRIISKDLIDTFAPEQTSTFRVALEWRTYYVAFAWVTKLVYVLEYQSGQYCDVRNVYNAAVFKEGVFYVVPYQMLPYYTQNKHSDVVLRIPTRSTPYVTKIYRNQYFGTCGTLQNIINVTIAAISYINTILIILLGLTYVNTFHQTLQTYVIKTYNEVGVLTLRAIYLVYRLIQYRRRRPILIDNCSDFNSSQVTMTFFLPVQ